MAKPLEIDATFTALRPRLFALAYRMLGRHAAAEDVVQETALKFLTLATPPDNPESWCVRTATNCAIDMLRAEKVRRSFYVGPWLPDPVPEDQLALMADDAPLADEKLVLAETVSTALLIVLESLGPTERAAFLLHDVFDYSYAEIASLIDRQESACRQIVSRARARVKAGKPRYETPSAVHTAITESFLAALFQGDVKAVENLLAADAVLLSDGGGKVRAALRPLHGAAEVAQVLTHIAGRYGNAVEYEFARFNGLTGVIMRYEGHIISATTYVIADKKVQGIYIVRNPDKLAHLH